MDRISFDIDEEDILIREYHHEIMSFHILLLLLMELVYIVIHVTASFWITDFHLINSISLFLSMDGVLLLTRKCFRRRLQQQAENFEFTSVLVSIALMSVILQVTIIPEDSLVFIISLLHVAFGSFVVTFALCSLHIAILS